MKKILSIILTILMITSIIPITASAETPTSGTCGKSATWEFDETTGTLTISGEGAMYDYYYHFYSSKDEVDTRPWASYDDLIEFVVIDDGITHISDYAFFSFNLLTIVTIPESVTSIGESAFESTELLVLHYIGTESQWNNITVEYGNSKLYENPRFYFVNFPISDSGTCGDTLAWNFDATTSILTISGTGAMYNDLGNYRDNSTRKQFDGERGWDYYKYHIEKIVITDGVTYIGQNAFDYHPHLKEVVIPNTVTEIHLHAFDNCNSLLDVYYSGTENDWNNVRKWDSLVGNSNSSLNNATIHYNYHTHVYESVVTEPNCTEQGYTTYTCECGDSYIDDYVDATGHNYVDNVCTGCGDTIILNGWQLEDGKWAYYVNNEKLTNKWIKDSVDWCYLGANGYCVTNTWKADSKGWCYLDEDCRIVRNKWLNDNGKWYFIDVNGYMVSNKWMKDSKDWVYLGSNGSMLTNAWAKDSKGWCYVGDDGYWVKSQWIEYNNNWYYIDSKGYMATGSVKIGPVTYKFASNGVWIE